MELTKPDTLPTILLTGASGVVGQALLERLGGDRVVALVHRKRLHGAPCRQVQGDITEPRLGLDRRGFDELAGEIDVVIHCAALTDFLERPADVTRVNIEAVDHVLDFVAAADAALAHVSSAFVARRDGSASPLEPESGARTAGAQGYVASKIAGEEAVRRSGIPHAIFRPSLVLGDSATGRTVDFQGFQALPAFLLSGQLPIVPLEADARCDFVAQDIVADAIAAHVDAGALSGEHWLTAGPDALAAPRLADICVDVGRERGIDVRPPRMIGTDVMHRLFLPVFAGQLPRRLRRRLENLVELASLFERQTDFPTSLPDIGARFRLGPLPDPERVFRNSCEYLAERFGLGLAAGDVEVAL